ncbi:hypothetical protein L4D15_08410 [Enterovibrio norvegicus]|uniref:hypothetical protein n=1 Tax=Enterovibrio norvegicus TaxID=188144 RepID=UPI003D110E10
MNVLANAACEIVSGRNSEYSKSVSVASKNLFKPPLSLARRGLQLSKCAEEAFSRWIRTKEQLRFVEGETCTADYGVVPAVAKKAFHAYKSRSSERRLLSFHYEHVAASHYDSMKGFLYEVLELEEAFLSLGGGKSAQTLILKDKTKKCSQCMVTECSGNKLIMATRVCSAGNSNLSRNPCDAQLDEYERQLEIKTGRLRLHHNWAHVKKQAYWCQVEKSNSGVSPLESIMNTSGLDADYPS